MASSLTRCALTTILENSFQLKRTNLQIECQKVFLHTVQKKAVQAAYNYQNSKQSSEIYH